MQSAVEVADAVVSATDARWLWRLIGLAAAHFALE
jgi:hypothetical protein